LLVPIKVAIADQNRSIALQYAKEGWGTRPDWEKTWDKLLSVGLAENKEFNKSLFEGFPDIRQRIEDVVVDGNNVVYRHTIEGTNTGVFLGTPATGKPVKVNGFTQLKISNGKITEMWYECNLLEVMQQIGLIPRST
jgi:predicted ester cyclase